LKGLRLYPIAKRVTDTRLNEPTSRTVGEVPGWAVEVAEQSMAELGLPGLIVAGHPEWTVCRGGADLDGREEVRPDHRLPACGMAKVITAVAVVKLIGDLDIRANTVLRDVRLDNDDITIRDLLTHTSGVLSPEVQFATEAPEF